MTTWESTSTLELASAFDAEQRALSTHNTDSERSIRLKYSSILRQAPAEYVLSFSKQLLFTHGHRWQAYEIIAAHRQAFQSLRTDELEQLGQGINSWWTTDSFARTLSGPAWRDGLVSDELIIR